jgi:hypothetical protein
MRFRHVFMGVGGALITLILVLTDPQNHVITNLPFGAGTLATLIVLFTSILFVGVLHLARRAIIDYVDLQKYFERALLTPEGAGAALIGVGLMMVAIAIVILAAVK